MLAKANTDHLRNAINKILSVVDKRNSRPILAYTLFETTKDGIYISATDLEVSAKVHLPANVEKEGSFCVNAKNLFDILKELPTDEVELEVSDDLNSLHLTSNNIHFTLLIYKNNDFPQLVFNGNENKIDIPSEYILNIINNTSHCISTDETRLYLNGVYLQEIDSVLRAVATDGHRLALVDMELSESNSEALSNGVIIPKKGVYELKKMAESNPDKIMTISVDDSFIYASFDEKYFLSVRLIAREYPKYQAVIPSKTS
jgi:DNA polymerase-3 subunit beta